MRAVFRHELSHEGHYGILVVGERGFDDVADFFRHLVKLVLPYLGNPYLLVERGFGALLVGEHLLVELLARA